MNLDILGEFGLIDSINITNYAPEQVIVGRGDDCAVLPFDETYHQVVSCDLLVEDVHFIRDRITPFQLGYKSVAVNLSDVAAMGGMPVHILVSLALPSDYTVEEWNDFYAGVDAICKKYRVNVIGGDTTSSKDRLTVHVTVVGLVKKSQLHLRSAAKLGDLVFVTGWLGGSRAGLELVLHNQEYKLDLLTEFERQQLLQCHFQPEPCCEEIRVLNELAGEHLHALNDISDGLLSECNEIAQASGMEIVLKPELIPIHSACEKFAVQQGADCLQWATMGGEDYQLVGTMAAEQAEEICQNYRKKTGKQITIVGFTRKGDGVSFLQDNSSWTVSQLGYNHFQKATNQKNAYSRQEDYAEQFVQKSLQELAAQEEALQMYRHDLQNHLTCIAGLLDCGEWKQAKTYLCNLIEAQPQTRQTCYSQRLLLNLLLNQKVQLAETQKMDVQITCEDCLLDGMTDYDLCTLLGNLLDNGIEHSSGTKERYLYLDIFKTQAGEVQIRMENSCNTIPVVQYDSLCSTKQDTMQHGKGMRQIKRIVERYGGQFHWTYDASQHRFLTICQFSELLSL